MVRIPRAAFVHARRRDAGNLAQLARQMRRILFPRLTLFFETGQLRQQERCLKLGNPQIAAVPNVGKTGDSFAASVVVKAPADFDEVFARRQNSATLSRVEVLRTLETETAKIAQRAQLAA